MEIRFECVCYDRTLVIELPRRYVYFQEEIMKHLNRYYDEWVYFETEEAEIMCLEEYIMYRFTTQYNISLSWYVEEN